MEQELMTTRQVAAFCGMTERCVCKAVTNNRISPISTKTPYRFSREEVERFQTTRLRNNHTVTSTPDLHIDSEFQELIAPLSDSEFKQLSDNCRAEGIRDPIIVWNNTIIDGHNRFRIAQEHKLSFKVKEMSFGSRDDVKHWIIANQLGRRNVTTYERCRLALLLKDSVAAAANQRMLAGKADPAQISAEGISGETRDILAKLAGVSHDTLSKVETLEREADDDMKTKLRAGNISVNKAWNILYPKNLKTLTHPTTTLDISCESVDSFSAHTSPPVDNATTSTASEVVPTEPQTPVSLQPSEDEVYDNATYRKTVRMLLTSSFDTFCQDFLQVISNNDFYCDEELLTKDWAHCFTAVVSTEFIHDFCQKFQQAREKQALTKVVVLIQQDTNIDRYFFDEARLVISNIRYCDYPYGLFLFDFTEGTSLTT